MSNKAYYFGDANAIARLMKKMYLGLETEVPVYEEREVTTTKQLSTANLGDFFKVTNGSGSSGWTVSDVSSGKIQLTPNNIGVNSSTAEITLTATQALTLVKFDGTRWVTEENYDKLYVALYSASGGTDAAYANGVSGTSSLGSGYGKSMEAGSFITLRYVKDSSGHATNESVTVVIECQDSITITTTEQVQVGTANKELARKVIRAYQPDAGGKARLWFDADAAGTSVTFSGTHTISDITIDGKAYKLMTMTGSGTLTVAGEGVRYWMCGSGAGGANASYVKNSSAYQYSGPGGAGGYVASGDLVSGSYTVVIGAGGEANNAGNPTSIGAYSTDGAASAIDNTTTSTWMTKGASGGGSGISGYSSNASYETRAKGSNGNGASTYPFDVIDLGAHSGGGGGGGSYGISIRNGGKGGTNGGNGGERSSSASSIVDNCNGGTGGAQGGGDGGTAYTFTGASDSKINGVSATFYGSGGGGGGYAEGNTLGTGGAGYQGVAYALWEAA